MNNRIRIKLGPIEFEAEGDAELIQREREQFFSLLPQAITAVSPVVGERAQFTEIDTYSLESDDNRKMSALPSSIASYESTASFLKEKSFANDVELVMGVAYYLYYLDNQNEFTSKEIESKLSEARHSKPSNISHCINQNIKKGYIEEADGKKDGMKVFRVLSEGIKWCESYVAPDTSAKKKNNRQQNSKIESSLIAIPLDELNLEKYCDIPSLKKYEDQVLVMMYIYTTEKNIEYFSYDDIVAVLKNKFKISISSRQVKYVFEKSGTKFDKKIGKKIVSHKLMLGGIREAEKIIAQQKENS